MSGKSTHKAKTQSFIACTLSAAMILSSVSTAFAGSSPAGKSSAAAAAAFNRVNSTLSHMSAKELKDYFTVRNAKGEVIQPLDAKEKEKGLWSTLDSVKDQIEGTSTEKVYQTFKVSSKKNEIIVAVIDSGVDIAHEDLRGKIWVNPGEIPGNGIDDDGDGYIDDVYGWNFLGNSKGENINSTTLEVTREYARMLKLAEQGTLSAADQAYLTQVETLYKQKSGKTLAQYDIYTQVVAAYDLLKANGLKEETAAAIEAIQTADPAVMAAKDLVGQAIAQGVDSAYAASVVKQLEVQVKYYYNLKSDSSTVVGDNPQVLDEKGYGNPNVTGPDARHGTHVAGIIAATRNSFGIDGQAANVKIMSLRAVPDGDERDKDVANAIKYAVDHGARVINMSFGKPLSPQKDYVDAAMKYAESKGVLLVHAAGNDGKNTESFDNNFPHKKVKTDTGTREIDTWIEVGASSKTKNNKLPASFSNWGQTSVDVFAPGTQIVSTVPGNKYESLQGTSMASPEVAGVAALLLNVFPFSSGMEIKNAIMSTTTQYPGLTVSCPGSGKAVTFSSLSKTGGIVNAYRAMIKLSEQNML